MTTLAKAKTAAKREGFIAAVRVHEALTAGVEKRALIWMSQRMPEWVTSDGLTALGLVAQVGAGAFYALARWDVRAVLGVMACIALNWFGDSMDGTLARVREQQRPRYGFYVDHMVDVLGAVAMMGGMALSGLVHWQVAMGMLIAFLVLASESYLATYTVGRFEMSQGIFGPTEIRLAMLVGDIALLRSRYATLLGHRFLLFDVGGTVAVTGMAVMVVAVTWRHALWLYRAEPLVRNEAACQNELA